MISRPVAALLLASVVACTPGAPASVTQSAAPHPRAQRSATQLLDPATLHRVGLLRLVRRTGEVVRDERGQYLRLEFGEPTGMAWLDDADFTTGTIEIDLRGRDSAGASFVGIAFNAADDSTYEAVYVRPFHFRSANPVSQGRMLQYVAHPAHTWSALRTRAPGVYEAAITPAPDPEVFLRLRLDVSDTLVRAFVNDATQPALAVRRLQAPGAGRAVALWIGNPSSGDFRDLRITRR